MSNMSADGLIFLGTRSPLSVTEAFGLGKQVRLHYPVANRDDRGVVSTYVVVENRSPFSPHGHGTLAYERSWTDHGGDRYVDEGEAIVAARSGRIRVTLPDVHDALDMQVKISSLTTAVRAGETSPDIEVKFVPAQESPDHHDVVVLGLTVDKRRSPTLRRADSERLDLGLGHPHGNGNVSGRVDRRIENQSKGGLVGFQGILYNRTGGHIQRASFAVRVGERIVNAPVVSLSPTGAASAFAFEARFEGLSSDEPVPSATLDDSGALLSLTYDLQPGRRLACSAQRLTRHFVSPAVSAALIPPPSTVQLSGPTRPEG